MIFFIIVVVIDMILVIIVMIIINNNSNNNMIGTLINIDSIDYRSTNPNSKNINSNIKHS